MQRRITGQSVKVTLIQLPPRTRFSVLERLLEVVLLSLSQFIWDFFCGHQCCSISPFVFRYWSSLGKSILQVTFLPFTLTVGQQQNLRMTVLKNYVFLSLIN